MLFNQDESFLHFIAGQGSGLTWLIWKYAFNDSAASWSIINNFLYSRSFTLIQGDDFFVASYDTSISNL